MRNLPGTKPIKMVTLDKKKSQIFFYILIKTKIVGTGKNCNIEVVVTFTYNLHFRANEEVMYATKTLILRYKKWGLNYT